MQGENIQIYTLITGASQGLGKAFARECAARGRNLLLISLPGEELLKFCREIREEFGVSAEGFETDLTQKESPEKIARWALTGYRIDMLINNAGLGGSKIFEECSADYLDRIVMLNVRALTLLTRLLLPELKQHPKSYILNVSSIAAFSPVPYKTVYPASKSFVYFFSRGLRKELQHTSVSVGVVQPGPIPTNPEIMERIRRQGTLARLTQLSPEKVARVSLDQLFRGRSVIVPGLFNKVYRSFIKAIPMGLRISFCSLALKREFNEKPAEGKKDSAPVLN